MQWMSPQAYHLLAGDNQNFQGTWPLGQQIFCYIDSLFTKYDDFFNMQLCLRGQGTPLKPPKSYAKFQSEACGTSAETWQN